MTRREFIARVTGTASTVCLGLHWTGRRISPHPVVQATRLDKYPGAVVPMRNIRGQSKWSG